MNPNLLPDIFHAHLHINNKVLKFPHKMTVTGFITANKDILSKIATDVGIKYDINPKEAKYKYYFRKGTESYLKAENMFIEDSPGTGSDYKYGLQDGVKKHS